MISTATPPLRIPARTGGTRRPRNPQEDQESDTRALRQQPGVPNRDGFQRQSEGRTRRHQEQATSADSTTSFIHPWALRQAHENLRGPRRSNALGLPDEVWFGIIERQAIR